MGNTRPALLASLSALLIALLAAAAAPPAPAIPATSAPAPPAPAPDFQRQVRPILSDNCFRCHGPDKGNRMADLRLDIREGAFAQRKNGSVIVPGKPDESLIVKRIMSEDPAFRMPPLMAHKTLTAEQKEIIRRWIEAGAPWKEHWAFIAPTLQTPPPVDIPAWDKNPIDHFILARLEAAALKPNPEADRRTLIRRVTLDLTGLPPTPAEVEAFVSDKSPKAYEKVVDRLLASPRYGEHRGRYWLDAARYADSQGIHIDNYREMWPYRDWVIAAFNRNMPFDRFTIEQLGGDLLPNATLDQKIASGFQRCNVTSNEGGLIPAEYEAIYAKDRADTTGIVWLGLTVGCATCHDHKFDPISQKDFYSLTAFYRNTTQNAMDGNIPDTPPTVVVPREQDRQRWQQLNDRRAALLETLSNAAANPNSAFDAWLASPQRMTVSLPFAQSSQLVEPDIAKLTLPAGVSIGAGPADAAPATGLHFAKESALTFPTELDSDKAFTVAAWVYLPKAKEGYAIASQYEKVPKKDAAPPASGNSPVATPPKQETVTPVPANPSAAAIPDKDKPKPEDATVRRGWSVSISDDGPSFRLQDDQGKYLYASAGTGYEWKPETWYHIAFTYDGSHTRKGISLYVNGRFIPTFGNGEDLQPLAGSTHAIAPVKLANNDKTYFENGAIADFHILNRHIDFEDAAALRDWLAVSAAASITDPTQLTPAGRQALADYFVSMVAPTTRSVVAQLHTIETERHAIAIAGATTFVMQERTGSEPTAHVLYRGQYDQMRDEVHAKTLGVLPPMPESAPRNRLGLAEWLVMPTNPLTARVTVNRFWQEVFGTGIVKTTEDFGSQGEPPTHPELLDWLAIDFRDSGWDVKKLFRLMVTSAAYRQSAATTEEKLQRDPDNRLLSRGPRYRMDAEMVRDYALAASGLLNPTIGGPSVKPYQPDRIWETVAMEQSNTRFYKRDTGDKLYRRSLYTFWKRSAPPPSMDIFNAPSRENCTVRRERTNTPLQALVTMNDPQFVEAARVLAQKALLSGTASVDGEVDYMAVRLLARSFDPKEKQIVARSYQDYLAYYQSRPDDAGKLLHTGEAPVDPRIPKPKLAAMTMVANELLNLDEVLNK